MPREKWTGYKRFCPFARALDLVGERWTLLIVHELLSTAARYSELSRRLPGIGSNVLADRLRKLEALGIVERRPEGVGGAVVYALTDAGRELEPALRELRRWGVKHLVDCDRVAGDGAELSNEFDMSFVERIDELPSEEYEWRIGDQVSTLSIEAGTLVQRCGAAPNPAVTVEAPRQFMQRWAAGETDLEAGREAVAVHGNDDAWRRMLAAMGYVAGYDPDPERD